MRSVTGNRKLEIYVVLVLLLAVSLFLGLSVFKSMPPSASGMPHQEIDGMRIGGDGASRISGLETASFIVFAATFLLFTILIISGVSKQNRTLRFWVWMTAITLLILFVWYQVFDSYMNYLSTGAMRYIMGFPEPSAWMIYGLWGGGALYALVYVVEFRRIIYSKEDEETLKDIVEEFSKEGEQLD
jgi:phosphotransferase system  glucose/maltose/N-acetylglucosamine-specific IIC component